MQLKRLSSFNCIKVNNFYQMDTSLAPKNVMYKCSDSVAGFPKVYLTTAEKYLIRKGIQKLKLPKTYQIIKNTVMILNNIT